MDWQLASLNNPYLAMFREAKLEPEKRGADFAAQEKDFAAQLAILDKSMKKWVAGDDMTIADFCLGPIVYRCLRFPVELPELPSLQRWDAAIASRQAFKKAIAA